MTSIPTLRKPDSGASRRRSPFVASAAATAILAGALAVGFAAPANAATPEELVPDANYRHCLEMQIAGSGMTGGVTEANLAALTMVSCAGLGIASGEGSQYLTNARFLMLMMNNITTMPSLSGLTHLNMLDVSLNKLTDTDFLAGFAPALTAPNTGVMLNLQDNDIADISGLSTVTITQPATAVQVYLRGNNVTDVAPLAPLLESIETAGISPGLTIVSLGDNRIADLSPLNQFQWMGHPNQTDLGGMADARCQTIDLGTISAGASVPLVLRDIYGDAPLVTSDCNNANPVQEIALPAGLSWNGDALVADPSLIGQTITFSTSSRNFTGGGIAGSHIVTLKIVAAPPTPSPSPSPSIPATDPGKPALADTGAAAAPFAASALALLFFGAIAFAGHLRRKARA